VRLNLWPKLLIVCGIILVFVLYSARENLRQDWDDLLESVRIVMDNFIYSMNPERAKGVTTLENEENLKAYVGEPFRSFRSSDWQKFWNVIYGVYPIDYSQNRRLPPRARQLGYAEMEARLKELYSAPFGYFKEEHWQQFWPLVLGKKARKR